MNRKRLSIRIILALTISLILTSCVMDYNAPYYEVRNCTNDTLLIDLTYSDKLEDEFYWGIHPEDTIYLSPDYIDTAYIQGEKMLIRNDFCALPDSTISGRCDIKTNTCYLYAIKWNIVKKYSYKEILDKKLYDRRVLTQKDFDSRYIYEYRYMNAN